MKCSFLLLCLLVIEKADAQQVLRGRILDQVSKKSLSLVTVSIYTAKDTGLINYGLTTTEGDFVVTGVPVNTLCRLVIFAAGHELCRKELQFTSSGSTELGYIDLLPGVQPESIAPAEQPPVMIFRDSIVYTPASFPTLPGSVINLIKKLPGIQFEKNGTITAGSQRINHITMDRAGLAYLDLVQ